MQELPWFIRNEIIGYIVSYRCEFCLVNKEWFTYAAGRFMNLKGAMIFKDEQPSDWFKLTEKLQLNSFSNLNKKFLKECCKIKRIDIKFKKETSKVPAWFLKILCKYPLETARVNLGYTFKLKVFQSLMGGINSQLKYLYIDGIFKSDFLENIFKFEFPKLVLFDVDTGLTSIEFSKIYHSMPSLENLKISLSSINLNLASSDVPIFNKLRRLQIECCPDYYSSNDFQIQDLFQFNFPMLKTFQLKYYFQEFNYTRISNSMPSLETLHLELASYKILSSRFPIITLPNLKELRLEFNGISQNIFKLQSDNLPQLRQLFINNDFDFTKPKQENCPTMTKLECHAILSFPISNIRKFLTCLNVLIVDCKYLGDKIHDILQLSDRVTELSLINLNQKLLPSSLPRGPFKTTHLNLKGPRLYNTDFIDWAGLNLPLTSLNLEFSSYKNLQINVKQFSKLEHFNLNFRSDKLNNFCSSGESNSSDHNNSSDDESEHFGTYYGVPDEESEYVVSYFRRFIFSDHDN